MHIFNSGNIDTCGLSVNVCWRQKSMAKFNCRTDQSLVTDRHGHLKKNWLRTLLREIELGHTLTLNVWENLQLGENQWKMIKTLYYIEVLGCLLPLLTIFQLYHSAWSSVLLVEENGKKLPSRIWTHNFSGDRHWFHM